MSVDTKLRERRLKAVIKWLQENAVVPINKRTRGDKGASTEDVWNSLKSSDLFTGNAGLENFLCREYRAGSFPGFVRRKGINGGWFLGSPAEKVTQADYQALVKSEKKPAKAKKNYKQYSTGKEISAERIHYSSQAQLYLTVQHQVHQLYFNLSENLKHSSLEEKAMLKILIGSHIGNMATLIANY